MQINYVIVIENRYSFVSQLILGFTVERPRFVPYLEDHSFYKKKPMRKTKIIGCYLTIGEIYIINNT